MDSIRERLRGLPSFPADMPELDPATAPNRPEELFVSWLDDAIASGVRQPHAMALTTARADGTPVARTLIIKDLDESGYHFSTHRTSHKGQQLDQNPRASLLFFWAESGRQVCITGTVTELSYEVSQADLAGRPSYDGRPNPDWQVYALKPDEYEFLQARQDRNHTRLRYHYSPSTGWTSAPASTPGG
jgi:pyridoxamine 5'-phosphate oxidase